VSPRIMTHGDRMGTLPEAAGYRGGEVIARWQCARATDKARAGTVPRGA
jgi:hypothetical protein